MGVLPACAGMNRHSPFAVMGIFRAPRMRGDEPTSNAAVTVSVIVLPACAGMNRDDDATSHIGAPRMRGDEPGQ